MVVREKEYMNLDAGKLVDYMTRESYITTESVKISDDCSSLVHSIEIGAYIDSNKTNPTYLVG